MPSQCEQSLPQLDGGTHSTEVHVQPPLVGGVKAIQLVLADHAASRVLHRERTKGGGRKPTQHYTRPWRTHLRTAHRNLAVAAAATACSLDGMLL